MTVFKGKRWIKGIYEKSKGIFKKIQAQDLTAKMKHSHAVNNVFSWIHTYKYHSLKVVGALSLLVTISLSGNHYVHSNTVEVYHVYVGKQLSGIVSDTKVVDRYIFEKYNELEKQYPDVHMTLNVDEIHYSSERAFKAVSDDAAALVQLDRLITAQASAVQLKVDDELIAIVKDEETAHVILDQIKNKYIPETNGRGRVSILSAFNVEEEIAGDEPSLEYVDFIQDVTLEMADVEPDVIMNPDEVLHTLETGDVRPLSYTVQEGDCVSCIAHKFDITEDLIYGNNLWLDEELIHIGDKLDLTILQPTLSVKTVEKLTADEEIEFETIYEQDPSLRAGQVVTLASGKNGKKKVTYLREKINGEMTDEQIVDEEVLVEPAAAVVKRGTKVIRGEGSGKFSWPVIGAKVSSGFGPRGGRSHNGIDITSANKGILASDHGKVVFAGTKNGYGKVIILDHRNGYRTLYAHLSTINVSEGNTVEKGEKIGVMGNTGDSHGVHLHFEVHKSGRYQNPMNQL